mmetsp:Transcript_10575/g.20422  ORF Transcript_10575/g.20422 Transcript_10575/m.20422 type:complete len:243 (-) Transcript_10575:150-878(-)
MHSQGERPRRGRLVWGKGDCGQRSLAVPLYLPLGAVSGWGCCRGLAHIVIDFLVLRESGHPPCERTVRLAVLDDLVLLTLVAVAVCTTFSFYGADAGTGIISTLRLVFAETDMLRVCGVVDERIPAIDTRRTRRGHLKLGSRRDAVRCDDDVLAGRQPGVVEYRCALARAPGHGGDRTVLDVDEQDLVPRVLRECSRIPCVLLVALDDDFDCPGSPDDPTDRGKLPYTLVRLAVGIPRAATC